MKLLPVRGFAAEHVGCVALAEPFYERPEPERDADENGVGEKFKYPPVHEKLPLLSFCCRKYDGGNRTDQAGDDSDCTATLPSMATVVFDAQLNTREKIRAFFGDSNAGEQRVAQPGLDRGHAITTAAMSSPESNLRLQLPLE